MDWIVKISKGPNSIDLRWTTDSSRSRRQLKHAVHRLTKEHAQALGVGIGDTVTVRGWPVNEDGEPMAPVDQVAVELEAVVSARAK